MEVRYCKRDVISFQTAQRSPFYHHARKEIIAVIVWSFPCVPDNSADQPGKTLLQCTSFMTQPSPRFILLRKSCSWVKMREVLRASKAPGPPTACHHLTWSCTVVTSLSHTEAIHPAARSLGLRALHCMDPQHNMCEAQGYTGGRLPGGRASAKFASMYDCQGLPFTAAFPLVPGWKPGGGLAKPVNLERLKHLLPNLVLRDLALPL